MARVRFTPLLRRHLALSPRDDVPGASVREVLEVLFAETPGLRSYLLEDHGPLRKHVVVFVDDEAVRDRDGLSDPVGDDSELYVMQALSGG